MALLVLERRFALLRERGHTLLLVVRREERLEQTTLQTQTFVEREIERCR